MNKDVLMFSGKVPAKMPPRDTKKPPGKSAAKPGDKVPKQGIKAPEQPQEELAPPTSDELVQAISGFDKIKKMWEKFKTWKEDDPRRKAFVNLVATGTLLFGVSYAGLKGIDLYREYVTKSKGLKLGRKVMAKEARMKALI